MSRFSAVLAIAIAATTGTLTAVTAPAFAQADKAATLSIGSPAPKLPVAEWVKGTPVVLGDGKVHVVEFWATWCGPCKTSIPHLTELAKKYTGKADFTGVSVFERGEGVPAKVKSFVTTMGAQMDYHVARDDAKGTIAQTWMQAANQDGIPTAFVVDKTGTVVWIGHPMDGLDEAVGKVVAGTYDIKAAKTEMKAKQEAEAKEQKFAESVAALDKTLEANPQYAADVAPIKISLMMIYDEAAAQKYVAKASGAELKNNAQLLNGFAWRIVEPKSKIKKPDYAAAVTIAEAAVKATNEKEAAVLDTLSWAQEKNGNIADAIKTAEKAVALYPADSKDPDLAEMKAHLAALKAIKPQ